MHRFKTSAATLTATTLAAALLAAAFLTAAPARADEIEDSLKMALEAYQAGDIAAAKEEIDFAAQLIAQMKAQGLSHFLPEALPGWEREAEENDTGTMMGMGGMMAGATYRRVGDNNAENLKIEIMAENQMVSAMAAMFANTAMMGSLGTVKRIGRQKVVITTNNDLQAMVDNRILIQVTGNAPVEDKEAYFAAIDVKALEEF